MGNAEDRERGRESRIRDVVKGTRLYIVMETRWIFDDDIRINLFRK
jgi:hypothetical protein